MSDYFDVVICCDLREDTPEEAIDAIRCLTNCNYQPKEKPDLVDKDYGYGNIWDGFYDHHFLAPDPERENISSFQRMWRTAMPAENNRDVYRYCLQYSGRNIHDDFWREHHIPFVYWLASYVFEDFIGYMKYSEGGAIHLMHVKNGKLGGEYFNSPETESDL